MPRKPLDALISSLLQCFDYVKRRYEPDAT